MASSMGIVVSRMRSRGTTRANPVVGFGVVGMNTFTQGTPTSPDMSGDCSLVTKAMALQDSGVKAPRIARKPKKPIPMPSDFKAALARNKTAQAKYDDFSPSNKREYLEWITGAKGEDTRARRINQSVKWISEGKSRNWKYM